MARTTLTRPRHPTIFVARMRLPAKLLFLFRIRFGLHAELTRLEAVADWAALEAHLCG